MNDEDFKKKLELLSSADLEKELRRNNLSPGYRNALQRELRDRNKTAEESGQQTPSLFAPRGSAPSSPGPASKTAGRSAERLEGEP